MRTPAAVLRRAFVAASVLWALALPLTSFAASRPAPANGWYAFAFVAYAVGSLVCHQRGDRSFHLWSTQMPVCARCTGIYIGSALAATVASMAGRRFHVRLQTYVASGVVSGFSRTLISAALPAMVTLVYEWTTGVTPSNLTRALTGAPLGAAVAVIVVRACGMPPR